MECYCVARNQPITREITRPQTATVISLWFWVLLAYPELYWAVYKSGTGTRGRGHWNACVGTNIRDARWRTWGHQVWDAGICGTGTRDIKYIQGCGDMGRRGMLMISAKVRVKCDISFFVKMCYLLSTLNSIIQNHTGHLMMFAQNISLYRRKRTDYCD